ncbi:hypothetical protein F4802DRAFT_616463 [Xylaria palmicola]|nr:hypothetical protein F4802DRAFT_616463 [Xylaria palmicola]
MRLISVKSVLDENNIRLVSVRRHHARKYAVLSHCSGWLDDDYRWGVGEGELQYQDSEPHINDSNQQIARRRVYSACRCARALGCRYIFIDNCCIAPQELLDQTANEMWRLYSEAKLCLVHLDDWSPSGSAPNEGCRWFGRCWSFTALMASRRLYFYDAQWRLIGKLLKQTQDRRYRQRGLDLRRITNINPPALFGAVPLSRYSVATKMRWANCFPECDNPEDRAYSLQGIFSVAVDAQYGEGGEEAFYRLEQAILRNTQDVSILAWDAPSGYREGQAEFLSILPDSPSSFGMPRRRPVVPVRPQYRFRLTDSGILMGSVLYRHTFSREKQWFYLPLGCPVDGATTSILLEFVGDDTFRRVGDEVVEVSLNDYRATGPCSFYIATRPEHCPE